MRFMIAALCATLVAAPLAHADDVSQLKQQVQALQQSLRSMQQSSIEKGVQSAEGSANIERIRHEFQSLQGSFDAVQFKIQNLQDSLNRYQQDSDSRLRAIEEKMDIMHKQGGVKSSMLDLGATGTGGEATLYQKGLSLVRDGNYTQAGANFRDFLQKYPKSAFAGNSQYWLAECYYAQKDYPRAIKEYQAMIANYPKLDKIQKAQDRIKLLTQTRSLPAPTRRPEDNIPLAPGAVKPKADLTPLPLNQSPVDR